MENVNGELQNIRHAIEKQNEIVQGMLNVMQKPESRFTQILQMIVLRAHK